jgi:serine/threonine protein kinase
MADRVGEQLGNYRLLKLIGRGGFADVYLGEHVRLGNQVAIKVLQAHLEDEDVERFQREARTIGRLAHPNIVRVYDFAVQDGTPFLAMDYAPNGTLRQRYAKGERLPLEAIIPYVRQVADALQYAHEQRVVHRDVKPENMLIGRLDDILLSDFGIAVVAQGSRYQSAHEMVGTVGYMAPELIQGHPQPASDQYALGIVVYEWLCGERPFKGGVTEVATQHLVMPPPPLRARVPTLSAAVEDVVLTALTKDPNRRFGSVRAFAAALENAARSEPSIHSLSTQLGAPVIPPAPGAPIEISAPPWSGPAGSPQSGVISPADYQGSPSMPYAPTITGSQPMAGATWANSETIRSSQPFGGSQGFGSQAFGSGAQGSGAVQGFSGLPSAAFGGPPSVPLGAYGTPSQPWGYGAPPGTPGGPQMATFSPPAPGGTTTGAYSPPVAPGGAAPPGPRRLPVLWIVIAVLVLLLGGGGGVAAFALLTTPHPVISVTSNYTGSALGGPPDTVLHVSGQKFSSNSTITFLLDGAPAPGAQLAQSDGNGSFTANLTITDDWTFATHTLTAKDAKGYTTQNGVSITVVPQPVLSVQSQYHAGTVPAGSTSTSFTVNGKRFSPNSTVTFLLDGAPAPGSQPTPADARGRVQITLTVTSAWSIGNHTLTAQDSQGHTTQGGVQVAIVHQGEADTPGPNGAPADEATFSIFVTVHARDVGTGQQQTFTFTLNVSNGKVCDNANDTGQEQTYKHTFSDGTSYTEHYVLTCKGTYKAGHLTYTETDTQDTFTLSDGGYCVAATPRINEFLSGTFSSSSAISGSFRSDPFNMSCPRVNTFYLTSSSAETGTWSGSV